MAAITNYSTLQQSVTQYLVNSDEAGMFDTFLGLAENRFNSELRVREMAGGTLTAAQTESTKDLGSDFIEALAVTLGSSGSISYLPPQKFFGLEAANSDTSGTPEFYTIVGSTMHFAPYGGSFTPTIRYYKTITPLSSSVATNELMPKAANLYLYAVLLEAQPFLNEPDRIPEFQTFYDRAKESLLSADARARFRPGVGQRMRANGVTNDGVFRIP